VFCGGTIFYISRLIYHCKDGLALPAAQREKTPGRRVFFPVVSDVLLRVENQLTLGWVRNANNLLCSGYFSGGFRLAICDW
jgi:hypothetical protein